MDQPITEQSLQRSLIEAALRIAGLALLLAWCFSIVRPFVTIVVWALVLAVALEPLHASVKKRLGGSAKAASAVLLVVGFAVLAVPVGLLVDSVLEEVRSLDAGIGSGAFGTRLQALWTASDDGDASRWAPVVRGLGEKVLKGVAGAGFAAVQLVVAAVVAGLLLAAPRTTPNLIHRVARRLLGDLGDEFVTLATTTVQSVARGILGVAVLEGLVAGLGLWLLGVPGAGLWALGALFFAIVQVPAPLLVLVPAIWLFYSGENLGGVLGIVLVVVIAVIDNVLKPILLGRGVRVPLVVMLLGALGGTITMGIIGLFVGPIVLVVGYSLMMVWLTPPEAAAAPATPG